MNKDKEQRIDDKFIKKYFGNKKHSEATLAIYKDIVLGLTRLEIWEKINNKGYENFPYDKSYVIHKRILADAYDIFQAETLEDRQKAKELFYNRYLKVYNDAMDKGDRANAIKCLDSLVKLEGLDEPLKIEAKTEFLVTME